MRALGRIERRLRVADELRGRAPPELADGLPVSWALREVDRATVLGWWKRAMEAPAPRLLAYVHVPFCRTRCTFCQFQSVVAGDAGAFLRELVEEAGAFEAALGTLRADAATIGGGTPSILSEDELSDLLEAVVGRVFALAPGGYFSVELNPDSTTDGKVQLLAGAGANRLSIGVQSLHPPALAAVARGYQTRAMVAEAVASVRRSADVQLSLDLLAPLPSETLATFRDGAAWTLDLGADQVVLYRYQPVRRGVDRTIEAGEMPWGEAEAAFREAARARGYVEIGQTGASVVVERPGARRFEVRYVQHPREPASLLGLGPFAESHAWGVGRYLADAGGRYRGEEVSVAAEQARFVGRLLGGGLPIEDAAFRAAFGRGLGEAFPDEVAWLEREGRLVRGGRGWEPAFDGRDDALRHAWLFFDGETAARVRAGPDGRRLSLEAAGARAGELAGLDGAATAGAGPPISSRRDDVAAMVGALRPIEARLYDLVAVVVVEEGRVAGGIAGALVVDDLLWDGAAGPVEELLARDPPRLTEAGRVVGRLLAAGIASAPRAVALAGAAEPGVAIALDLAPGHSGAVRALVAAAGAPPGIVPAEHAWERVDHAVVGGAAALVLRFSLDPRTSPLFARIAPALPPAVNELLRSGALRYERDAAGGEALVALDPPRSALLPALDAAMAAIAARARALPATARPVALRIALPGLTATLVAIDAGSRGRLPTVT